ncbi:MAG: Rrf2 family transcriptional regulator [Bacteroidales bacterium]
MSKVIHFPKNVSIAFYSLIFLSLMKKKMNVEELAKYTHSSKNHTAMILKNLAKHGYLKSNRGPDGGFRLNIPAEEISLLKIWELIEGKFVIVNCLSHNKACVKKICIFSDKIYHIHKGFYDFLQNNTIGSLANRLPDF